MGVHKEINDTDAGKSVKWFMEIPYDEVSNIKG